MTFFSPVDIFYPGYLGCLRQSSLFVRTEKHSKDLDSKNARLLQQAGLINQQFAGVYTFLPLGLRVLRKIEGLVRAEMCKLADEILMPALSRKDIWETTGRYFTMDNLFITHPKFQSGSDIETFVLQGTHEETVTNIMNHMIRSYRDLPFGVFQIQTKFRSEHRSKSGILRGREFIMKDLYSFHLDESCLKRYYDKVRDSYVKIFEQMGFKLGEDLFVAKASGGDFTPDFSHEFQILLDVGEDEIFIDEVSGEVFNREVAPSSAPRPGYLDSTHQLPFEEIYAPGVIGVEDLSRKFSIAVEQCVKTLIYKTNADRFIAVALRGDYEVNEYKLCKIIGAKSVTMASSDEVKNITGAQIGYTGILNLNSEVKLVCDDSISDLINFESGVNKDGYHALNVNWDRDVRRPEKFFDVKLAERGDVCPLSGKVYKVFRACEVGNIFPLNTKFSSAFELTYLDRDGKAKPVYMGCYGIGITRLMGVVVEKFSDEKGIVWPKRIAPFQVHLLTIAKSELDNPFVLSEQIYQDLLESRIEVLWDDRIEVTPGEKLAESDLIGIPIRIVVSERSINNGGIELKLRSAEKTQYLSVDNVKNKVQEIWEKL